MAANQLVLRRQPAAAAVRPDQSDQVKLAKLALKAQKSKERADLVRSILDNPVIEFATFIALLEVWYRYKAQHANSVILDIDSLLLFTAGSGIIAAKQIAPALPSLANAGGDLLKSLPAIAALIPK